MLEMIWFTVNMIFVALLIVFMFLNRSYQEARRGGEAAQIQKMRMRRNVMGMLAVAACAGMVIAFLANMHVNG